MGRLAKQKTAERRGPTYDLPPPEPKPTVHRKRPKKNPSNEELVPKPALWQGHSIPELELAIRTSYFPMLRSRLVNDLRVLLPDASPLQLNGDTNYYEAVISNALCWEDVLRQIVQDKEELASWRWDEPFVPPKKRHLLRPQLPVLTAGVCGAGDPEVC